MSNSIVNRQISTVTTSVTTVKTTVKDTETRYEHFNSANLENQDLTTQYNKRQAYIAEWDAEDETENACNE